MKFILFFLMSTAAFSAPIKYKYSKDKMVECGKFAEEISLKLTETIYPKKAGVNPVETPTPPYEIGSLDPNSKVTYLPYKQNKDFLVYATGNFTRNENWECAYYVTMQMQSNGSCAFQKIEMNNCGGGVHYPDKKK